MHSSDASEFHSEVRDSRNIVSMDIQYKVGDALDLQSSGGAAGAAKMEQSKNQFVDCSIMGGNNMLNTKNRKRMWTHAGIILMVLVAIALSSGCLEKNPIDKLSEGAHKEIDPYKGEKGDYEQQSKELDKQVQEQSGEPEEKTEAKNVII